ncbi:MAG: TrbG/VirB9 family P-type conjugative transfer protein [Candidatus Midichloria sp.]|nr:TrbG/VirB9 family P-type conjugative transfer protein [Candidatus Midichloria sp.]
MTVITNKRMYFFEMQDATDIDDDNLSFVVKLVCLSR